MSSAAFVALAILIGAAVYFAILLILRVDEVGIVMESLKRRKKGV
jgi:hypothetical protein